MSPCDKKLYFTFLLFLLLRNPVSAQDDTLKVLFLGNSYTYTNDLPGMFRDLSESGGKFVVTAMNAPGGYWLEYHCSDPNSLNRIAAGIWDYVILQEQSQVPTIDYYRYNSMYPSAEYLDSLIQIAGENTAFFMTWGRKYGGQQTIGPYSSPVFTDFFHMQDSLHSAYTEISNILGAALAPVGDAWGTAFSLDSTVNLWQADLSHPTVEGSYLSACVFYAVFFDESPVGLTYYAGLDPQDALFLQNAAQQTVLKTDFSISSNPHNFISLRILPNPFNSSTGIYFKIPQLSSITLTVFDIMGRKIQQFPEVVLSIGEHYYEFEASSLASGIYFAVLNVDNHPFVQKMLLVK